MENIKQNLNEQKNVEPKEEHFEAVELLIDCDSVNVSKSRYKALIKSEVKLEIVEELHRTSPSYKMNEILVLLFGPKDEANA